jgi:xylan 1,4-beta-xylosidase
VWNEYDYPGFWNSDAAHYYTLYDSASRGVRSVDTNILIGGPATTGSGPLQNFWNNCNAYGIKSLTNHNYGAAPGNTSDPVNIRSDNRVRSGVIRSSGRNLLSLNTEYNSTYGGAGGNTSANCYSMDSHINASFVAKTVKLIIADCIGGSYNYPDVLSYWALSDVFDECGSNNLNSYIEYRNYIPFGQVFGLINYQGIRKAAFNAFKMLHTLGNTGLSLTGGSGDADGVDGIATVSADTSEVKILIYSYYTAFNVTSADNTVNLIVNHLPFANGQSLTVHHYRIDSLHNNPYGVWQRLGSPAVPTTAQWDSLRAHDGRNGLDSLEASTTITYTGATLTKSFAIPRYGVSLLTYAKYIPTKVVTTVKPVGHVNLSMRGTRLIVSDQQKGPVNILIFSADGRFLKEYRVTQGSFDLRKDLSRGFYLVRAEADGMRIVRKMMVQ